jgi:ureidoglycolate hydrolase
MRDDDVREVRVPVVPMTAESFAPYGTVFGLAGGGADRIAVDAGFWHEGKATLGTIWNPQGAFTFSELERHYNNAQAFAQLSGSPSVVCVAAPTDMDDVQALPDPEDVRGFLIDPAQGYVFHRGTWHVLDRCVLKSPGASFLIVNSDPNPTQIVDFATRRNWMHPDLGGLARPQSLPFPERPPCRFTIDKSGKSGVGPT